MFCLSVVHCFQIVVLFSIIGIHNRLVLHSPDDGHLSCFWLSTIMNKFGMNIPVYVLRLAYTLISLAHIPAVQLLNHSVGICLALTATVLIVFQSHTSTSNHRRVPVIPHPSQCLVFSVF